MTLTILPRFINITHIDMGAGLVPFADGMTLNDTPRFQGVSSGIEQIRIVLCGQQVGGNSVSADGGWIKGQKIPLPAGPCDILGLDHLTGEILYSARVTIR